MSIRSSRYRFVLVDEGASLPVLYQQPRRSERSSPTPTRAQLEALLEAFMQLGRRGPEQPESWAPPLAVNPLSFLLDAIHDAVVVRRPSGEILYRNRAADALGTEPGMFGKPRAALDRIAIGSRRYERRCLTIDDPARQVIIEILSEVPEES